MLGLQACAGPEILKVEEHAHPVQGMAWQAQLV